MNKKNNNKGFTLAELLIVVAIIAVLVAIAIPVFTSQLEKSREATDAANVRSEYAIVMTDVLTSNGTAFDGKHEVTLKQLQSGWQNGDTKNGLLELSHKATDSADTSVEITGIDNVNSGGKVTFSYATGTGTTPPKVTIAF